MIWMFGLLKTGLKWSNMQFYAYIFNNLSKNLFFHFETKSVKIGLKVNMHGESPF